MKYFYIILFFILLFCSCNYAKAIFGSNTISGECIQKKIFPSVVRVYVHGSVMDSNNQDFFKKYTDLDDDVIAVGSGVIIDATGKILTCSSLLKDSEYIDVVLSNNEKFEAHVILLDSDKDLAMLKIDENMQFNYLDIGNSAEMKQGDKTFLVSNVFGSGNVLTSGSIISKSSEYNNNSYIVGSPISSFGSIGGVLLDKKGMIIGISIGSHDGYGINQTFAIKTDVINSFISNMYISDEGAKLLYPWIGVEVNNITSDIVHELGDNLDYGVVVSDIDSNGLAHSSGLLMGDIIYKVDKKKMISSVRFYDTISGAHIGNVLSLHVKRVKNGGKDFLIKLKVETPPEIPFRDERIILKEGPFFRVKVANMSPLLAAELGMDVFTKGVVILEGNVYSGLNYLDIIHSVDNNTVNSTEELDAIIINTGSNFSFNIIPWSVE